jgi:hypothetical protein
MNIKSVIESVIEFFKEYGEGLLVLTIPTIMVISILIFIYCEEPDREYNTNVDNSNIAVHTIDNHEYLVYHYNNAGGMCHKVDCKFCMDKNK